MRIIVICILLFLSSISFAQPPLNTKNKKCLSGNCENGTGKLSLPEMKNLVQEGKFTKGLLNGEGKAYYTTANGREYIAEIGKYINGYIKSGLIYNETGTPLSDGEYSYLDNGKRFLKSGVISIKYRGKEAKLRCSEMSLNAEGDDLLTFGVVDVFEGFIGTEGRNLAQYTSKGEYRDGSAWEWDYENSVKHYLYYDKGVLSDSNRIKTIPDNKWIAKQVKYLHPRDDLFLNNIDCGTFSFNGGAARYLICNNDEGTLDFFKKDYVTYNAFDYSIRNGKVVRKTAAEIKDLENLFKKQTNSTSTDKTSTKYGSYIVADCEREIQSIYKSAMYALSYYRAANQEEKGYAGNKRAYQQSQKSIIAQCDRAIPYYEGKVPPEMINQLREIKDALKTHNLGMGILRSIPISRD